MSRQHGMIHVMGPMYSLLLAMGAVIGLGWSAAHVPPKDALRVADLGVVSLLGALAGGRLGYVAANWDYFQTRPSETWQIWLGGLAGIGAVWGFIIIILLLSVAVREHPGKLADRLLPLGLSLGASAWLAAWWAGSAYGIQAVYMPETAWLALPTKDESGLWSLRWPTQLAGAVLTLALWALIERFKWAEPGQRAYSAGRRTATALLGIGAIFFGLSYTRVDPTRFWHGVRMDAWGGLSIMAIGLAALLVTYLPISRRRKS